MAQVCQGLYPKTSYSMGKKAAQNLTDEETEDQDQDREGYKDEWVSWKLDRERMTNVRCSSGKWDCVSKINYFVLNYPNPMKGN